MMKTRFAIVQETMWAYLQELNPFCIVLSLVFQKSYFPKYSALDEVWFLKEYQIEKKNQKKVLFNCFILSKILCISR